MAIVLYRRGNAALPQILDAMVADRNLMGIPAQVFDHLWCAHKGTMRSKYRIAYPTLKVLPKNLKIGLPKKRKGSQEV